jgi:hypothetical protein
VFYKLVDVAINQLLWRFEGQRNVADLFNFLFPDVLLKLSDAHLETEAQNLQMAYSAIWEKLLFQKSDHSVVSSVKKSKRVSL